MISPCANTLVISNDINNAHWYTQCFGTVSGSYNLVNSYYGNNFKQKDNCSSIGVSKTSTEKSCLEVPYYWRYYIQ